LGAPQSIQALGGTATPKWTINTSEGRYVVRIKPDEFSDANRSTLTHHALTKLADAGLPVHRPLPRSSGETLYTHGDFVIEVLEWIEGEPWVDGSAEAVRNLGVFLARFHAILDGDISSTTQMREDHPDTLQPIIDQLIATASDTEQLNTINGLLSLNRQQLDQSLYSSLPRALIHGDFHPGNIRFHDVEVAALYDFDYLDTQARVRDLVDALMFFASNRDAPFNSDDIHSLTQPFTPNLDSAKALFSGYQSITLLNDSEWLALPLLIRSRWIQMRLRGARKVPTDEQLDFVLTDFFVVTNWLDGAGRDFFQELRQSSPA
jgi:Ser/Thr protein kinase RdoA (MazF antagonist)